MYHSVQLLYANNISKNKLAVVAMPVVPATQEIERGRVTSLRLIWAKS
jgi:hypothetical protein